MNDKLQAVKYSVRVAADGSIQATFYTAGERTVLNVFSTAKGGIDATVVRDAMLIGKRIVAIPDGRERLGDR